MFEKKSTHGQEKVRRSLDETRGDQIYVCVFLMALPGNKRLYSMTFLCVDWLL